MKKATKINLTLLALVLSANGLYAQQGFGTNQPSKASVIDLQSDSKGLLVPRVALTSLTNFLPVKGETATNIGKTNSLLVYNTATVGTTIKPGYYYWTTDGTAANSFWKRLLANDDSTALALTGDVTGTLGATVVGGIQGVPVANTAPTNNQVLTYNGTAWAPTAISPATITGKGTLTTEGGIEFTPTTNGTDKLLGNATIQISDLGVTTTKLAADAVTNAKLADNAVQTENIANRNVTAAKLTAGSGTAGRVAVADANGVVTYTNVVPSSSVSGQDVTAASTKVTLAGTPAGAALKAFSIDVNEANLTLNNIGGTLNANKITPGSNNQVLTTNGSGATVWADKSSLITSVSNTSTGNSLTTTVNGTTGAAVDMINSNGLSLNASNQLVSTVNGVASTGLDLTPAVKANQQNTIVQGTGAVSVPAAVTVGNNTTYTVGVATATNTGNLGVVKQAATNPSVNVAADGTLSVNVGATGIGKTLTGSGITVTAGSTVGAGTSLTNTVLADVTLGIADNAITNTKIANNAVTVGKLPAGASATTFLRGDGTWVTPTDTNTTYTGSTSITLNGTSFERAALTGDVTAPANSNVTTIADNAVNSAKIANGSIQGEDLNANVAGNGLTQAAGGALQVNANNGLTVNTTDDAVQLGGSLTKPTTITTTAVNTLALSGLQAGLVGDKIIVADTNGVLKTVEQTSVAIEPWNVQGPTPTNIKATLNDDNIYQMGSVAIGKSAVTTHIASSTSSKLDVLGAVRIGTSSGPIGSNSLTVGTSSRASGANSLAVGSSSTVSGANSLAVGSSSTVSGENSLSTGLGNTVSGFASFSAGSGNSSKGIFSSTLGNNNETAEVSYAAALGGTGNKANAMSSVTVGGSTNTAAGDNSFATGLGNISQNLSEAVLGRYNAVRTDGNGTTWGTNLSEQNSRTLLQIGNGSLSGSTITGNNALTLTQSGRLGVGITGVGNAALPTQTLDVGNGSVRVRDINTLTGQTTDRIVVADTNGVLNTIPASSFASNNIYTSNGTLAGNRTVTQGSNTLTFNSQIAGGTKFITDGTVGIPKPAIQIQDGNQGAGKVLTSDASGTATWSTLPTSVSSVSVTAPITNTGTATAPNIGISRNSLTTATSSASETNAVVITNGSNAVINGANTSLQINNTAPLWNANQLRGQNISATAPTNAQVLQYNGTNWAPATLTAATVTAASNGINLNGTTVELGGNLTKTTAITQNGNPLTIATGGTALTISGLPTGVTADKALVATSTGVVKQVRQAPRFFYMPAVIFDTSTNGTNLKRNLYDEYVKQFQGGQAGAGSATYNIAHGSTGYSMPYAGGIVGSTGAPADIPVYGSGELYYYVTYYDTAVFSNLSINASGELTYNIISNASNVSYMNIVFVVIE